jgi:predicted PurR-regulated permease PerM
MTDDGGDGVTIDPSRIAPTRTRLVELLDGPFDVRSLTLTGLFVLATFYTLYFARAVLLPIVLALFLSYLLRPIVRGLSRAKVPSPLSAAVILITVLASIGWLVSLLATPAAGWLQKAP